MYTRRCRHLKIKTAYQLYICLENRNFHPVADAERPQPAAAAPRQHDHSARKATSDSLFK